jgi:hypothetical protein
MHGRRMLPLGPTQRMYWNYMATPLCATTAQIRNWRNCGIAWQPLCGTHYLGTNISAAYFISDAAGE